MESRLKLSKTGDGEPVDATFFRSIVGSLRYLVHTRPDITFAVGYVSRFMEAPTTTHLAAVKHLLRYTAVKHPGKKRNRGSARHARTATSRGTCSSTQTWTATGCSSRTRRWGLAVASDNERAIGDGGVQADVEVGLETYEDDVVPH
jgi:hypothetical protein